MKKNNKTFNCFGKQITEEQLQAINRELDRHEKEYKNGLNNSKAIESKTYENNNSDYYPAGCSDEYIDKWS